MIVNKNGTSIKWSMEEGDHSKLLIEGQEIEIKHMYNSKIVLSVLLPNIKKKPSNMYDEKTRTFFIYLWEWDVPCNGSCPYLILLPHNDQKLENFQLISTIEVTGKALTTMYNKFNKKIESKTIPRWQKSA